MTYQNDNILDMLGQINTLLKLISPVFLFTFFIRLPENFKPPMWFILYFYRTA